MTNGELDPENGQPTEQVANEEDIVDTSAFESTTEPTIELSTTDKRSALIGAGFADAGIDYMWLALGNEFYMPDITPESAAALIYERAGSPAIEGEQFDPIKRLTQVLQGVFNQDIATRDHVAVEGIRIWNLGIAQAAHEASVEN